MCAESRKMFSLPASGCGEHKFHLELPRRGRVGGAKPETLAGDQGSRFRLVLVAL